MALVTAKLDLLARNARFLLYIVEGTGEAGVVICDLPSVPPGQVSDFGPGADRPLRSALIGKRTLPADGVLSGIGHVGGFHWLRMLP